MMYDLDIPSSIKGKITELMTAANNAAFAGTMSPQNAVDARQSLETAKYNLQATIKTALEKARKGAA